VTIDLDVVDRMLGDLPQLEVLRLADGAAPVDPAAVVIPTRFGDVRVDVLEVRQIELDQPSDDPGDRLHASSHAWAHDSATEMTVEVVGAGGLQVAVTTPVAEPGPLIAMKLQAVMNRSVDKQGTDLLDIVRLTFDGDCRHAALTQLAGVEAGVAHDVTAHVDLWFVQRRQQTVRWIRDVGGDDVTIEDLELVAELLTEAARRSR